MSTAQLSIGSTLLGGKYRIEAILGQGGFGITYMAVHTILGKKVAIKEFFPKEYCDRDESTSHITLGTQSNADFVTRLRNKFIKEAQNISKLNHKNIIQIQDIFEQNNTAYYVMEYIDGASLEDIVAGSGAIAPESAVRYMTAIGEALSHMHASHMIHLDVKPANIMIRTADDCPILIDFGLSKGYGDNGGQTSTTPHGVSHGYSPLEQYNADGVSRFSPQTDIYAFGATLFKLLTGDTPPAATKRLEQPLTFPETMSPSMRQFIDHCMALSKNSRPADMPRALDMLATCDIAATPPLKDTPAHADPTEPTKVLGGKKKAAASRPSKPASGSKKGGPLKYIFIILGIVAAAVIALALAGIFTSTEQPADTPAADTATAAIVPAESEQAITPAEQEETETPALQPAEETKPSDKPEPKKEEKKATVEKTSPQSAAKDETPASASSAQSKQAAVKLAASSVGAGTMDAGLRVTGATVAGSALVFNVNCDQNVYDADDCTPSNAHFRRAINAYMGSSSAAASAAKIAKQNGMSVRFNFNGARNFSIGY